MIVYDKLWEAMKARGITKYQLREKYNIEQKTLRRLKNNENIETKTLDRLCDILDCELNEIATYKAASENPQK